MIHIEKQPPKKIETLCKITCKNCGAELSYVYDEDCYTVNGKDGFLCPCCGDFVTTNYVEEDDENLPVFPENFFHFGQSKDSLHIEDEEIQDWVNKTRDSLLKSENDIDWAIYGTGDSIVIGFKTEDQNSIFVCRRYYEWDGDFKD